jgi:hypothetical protein
MSIEGKSLKVMIEHNQSLGNKPNQVKETNIQSRLIGSSKIFICLLTRHPGLLLTGLLTMTMGTAALAVYSLSYVGDVSKPEPEEVPVIVEKPIITSSENSNPTPLWLVVAIALSCASGCLIIFRLVNSPDQYQPPGKPIKSNSPSRLLRATYQPELKPESLNSSPVFVPLQPLKPVVSTAKLESRVRVTSPEHRHRVDKTQETLADLMDIRKKSSLSTILQKH